MIISHGQGVFIEDIFHLENVRFLPNIQDYLSTKIDVQMPKHNVYSYRNHHDTIQSNPEQTICLVQGKIYSWKIKQKPQKNYLQRERRNKKSLIEDIFLQPQKHVRSSNSIIRLQYSNKTLFDVEHEEEFLPTKQEISQFDKFAENFSSYRITIQCKRCPSCKVRN